MRIGNWPVPARGEHKEVREPTFRLTEVLARQVLKLTQALNRRLDFTSNFNTEAFQVELTDQVALNVYPQSLRGRPAYSLMTSAIGVDSGTSYRFMPSFAAIGEDGMQVSAKFDPTPSPAESVLVTVLFGGE